LEIALISGRCGPPWPRLFTPVRVRSAQLWKLAPNPVDLMVIEGAGHYEMYDEPEYVDAAVDRLADFYSDNL
jgi:fermentation-respiration switch protein FrsA (DUF1100 family)